MIKIVIYLFLIMELLAITCYAYGPVYPLPRPPADPHDATVGDTIQVRASFRGFLIGLTVVAFICIVIAFIFYYCCASSSPASY